MKYSINPSINNVVVRDYNLFHTSYLNPVVLKLLNLVDLPFLRTSVPTSFYEKLKLYVLYLKLKSEMTSLV